MQKTLSVEYEDPRIDRYLKENLEGLSRSYIQKLLAAGSIRLDGRIVKSSEPVGPGMRIDINLPPPQPVAIQPEAIPLDIVFEDRWLIVVNKPQGMVVHPAVGHKEGTLVHALLHHCQGQLSDLNGRIRPGIIHRIDKDTSGLLLVVKDNQVHHTMAEQIRQRDVKRVYEAVVHGSLRADEALIEAPIGRDPHHRQRMNVVRQGKEARTHYRILQRFRDATHVQVTLETGRTHQIRVHFKYIGHPLIGDPLYAPGRKTWGMQGQALHAASISFMHPISQETVQFSVPPPENFQTLLQRLE